MIKHIAQVAGMSVGRLARNGLPENALDM